MTNVLGYNKIWVQIKTNATLEHGTLALGETIANTFLAMYFLERACEMQVASLAGNRKLHFPADEVKSLTAQQGAFGLTGVSGLAWPALLRKLDRKLPGYAE